MQGRASVARDDPCGQSQAKHEGVLGRRHIEQSVEFETKTVIRRGGAIFVGVGDELIPNIQRILLMLPAFFFAEL